MNWRTEMKRRAQALAKAVEAALMRFF